MEQAKTSQEESVSWTQLVVLNAPFKFGFDPTFACDFSIK